MKMMCSVCGKLNIADAESHWQESPKCERVFILTKDCGVGFELCVRVPTPKEVA